MKIFTALLVALANSSAWAEEVYLEVNDEGMPTFSDQTIHRVEPIISRKLGVFTDTTYQQSQLKRRRDDSLTPMKNRL